MTETTTMRRAAEQRLTTLLLNADGRPLSVWPPRIVTAKEAIKKLLKDRIVPLEEWDEEFHSEWRGVRVPKVAMLRHYANILGEPKFCRRSIFLRDEWICQYCGEEFPDEDLTFDHVVPRERGGQTVWENIVTACFRCNGQKGSNPVAWSAPKGSGLRPFKPPHRPTNAELLRKGLRHLPPEIVETWREWLYWEVELER